MTTNAFFLAAETPAGGQRFCLLHSPERGLAHGAIVYVHPFAEEMNKSRRMAALQSRAFAAAGYAVLQIDLIGCGDSSGDFEDATWSAWVDDVVQASHWLRARTQGPLWLWGLRAGCLLASEAAERIGPPLHLLFWQPTPAGSAVLQQFLRLRTAGDLLAGNAGGGTAALHSRLAAGDPVDVAGYRLAPGLALGLERAELAPSAAVDRLDWLELSTRVPAQPLPASARSIERWQQAACQVRVKVVDGPSFWQTSEIELAPSLLAASVAALPPAPTIA